MSFWNRVKEELDYLGISQKEFANTLNLNIHSFRNSMSLNRLPSLDLAYKIAKGINRPLEYLINGDELSPSNNHLQTREITLLTNYRKLSTEKKDVVDTMISIISSD